MEIPFWEACWREGRIGFHEGRPNALLVRHVARLGPPGRRVLVPLCGKTEDLAFLARSGHDVVGIEVVAEAARTFFAEHAVEPEVATRDGIPVYRGAIGERTVEILAADVFACARAHVGEVDALFDRGALVALAAEVRPRYVAHLRGLLGAGARGLVVSLEYDETRMSSPPFSVGEAEIERHFAGTAELARLEETPGHSPRFAAAEVPIRETCYFVRF